MSGSRGRRLDDTIWFGHTELEFRCTPTSPEDSSASDPAELHEEHDGFCQQIDTKMWSAVDSVGKGLVLVPDNQPTIRTRFRLASVSSSGSALCSQDYVSIWSRHHAGKCLALTGPVDDSLVRGVIQELLQDHAPPPGLAFQKDDTGPHCWFQVFPLGELSATRDGISVAQVLSTSAANEMWKCENCRGFSPATFRACQGCRTARPNSATRRRIQLGEPIAFVSAAEPDYILSCSFSDAAPRVVCTPVSIFADNSAAPISSIGFQTQVAPHDFLVDDHEPPATSTRHPTAEDSDPSRPRNSTQVPGQQRTALSGVAQIISSVVNPTHNEGIDAVLTTAMSAVPTVTAAAERRYRQDPLQIVPDILAARNPVSALGAALTRTFLAPSGTSTTQQARNPPGDSPPAPSQSPDLGLD
eukprot:m.668899 g.668899  ORF g.668899 m.668899 type:complete len:414 (-) comp22758_c0_seq7:398-1639(-)